MTKQKQLRPFGIEHLTEVSDKSAREVNGGAVAIGVPPMIPAPLPHHPLHHRGPVFHTNYISIPSHAFPRGDHG